MYEVDDLRLWCCTIQSLGYSYRSAKGFQLEMDGCHVINNPNLVVLICYEVCYLFRKDTIHNCDNINIYILQYRHNIYIVLEYKYNYNEIINCKFLVSRQYVYVYMPICMYVCIYIYIYIHNNLRHRWKS